MVLVDIIKCKLCKHFDIKSVDIQVYLVFISLVRFKLLMKTLYVPERFLMSDRIVIGPKNFTDVATTVLKGRFTSL